MGIDQNGIVYYEFTEKTNKSNVFQIFMKKLYSCIDEKIRESTGIIKENGTVHVSSSTK